MILNLFGRTEVDEIINKESQIQRWFIGKDQTGENTGSIWARVESERSQDFRAFLEPVTWRTSKTVERLFEKEIGFRWSVRTAMWRFANVLFGVR